MSVLSLSYMLEDHPRIRGEHVHPHGSRRHAIGIIPAYAGSTLDQIDFARLVRGSSPHTRGALSHPLKRYVLHEDHPRIRGEHCHF